MFLYAGIICLIAAMIFLLMETQEARLVIPRNIPIISAIIIANFAAFFWGRYYSLTPVFFVIGLVGTSIISTWIVIGMKTKDLVTLIVASTLLAAIDEYAHTSAGTLKYFDQGVPSLLTVFGWSLFLMLLVAVARVVTRMRGLAVRDAKAFRTVPVMVLTILILVVTVLQRYGSVFNWVMVLVYTMLILASFHYSYLHSFGWNLFLVILSLVFGFGMEYMGRLEGLWTFRFMEPVSLLILFSWPLRTCTVNAFCCMFNVDFSDGGEPGRPEMSLELDSQKSIFVVADTHFGLKKDDQYCDPNSFSDFLNWMSALEREGKETLRLGFWSEKEEHMHLRAPEKFIFLGDILELWDATANSINLCTRSVMQSVFDLACEKIYVLGNHDYDLADTLGKYPFGSSTISIVEEEYATTKGNQKYLFVHGHQFDKLFTLPSWRALSYIRHAALALGLYNVVFVVLFIVGLGLEVTIGFGGVADKMLLSLLGAISVPFLLVRFGRDIWNHFRSTRHKPREAEIGFERWWKAFSQRAGPSYDWNIIYGHTHTIDFWRKIDGEKVLTMFNIPSWVRDFKQKGDISLEKVLRHTFLYIDDETVEFLGWDTRKKRPFLIPKDVIIERRQKGEISGLMAYGIDEKLRDIGWPEELIGKWLWYNVADDIVA